VIDYLNELKNKVSASLDLQANPKIKVSKMDNYP
jgi:hypothetical protein